MNTPRHETPAGWALVERDVDFFGRVAVYGIEGTNYEAVRTPKGWRARIAAHGNARRRLQGPAWESAVQVVSYLAKYAYIGR